MNSLKITVQLQIARIEMDYNLKKLGQIMQPSRIHLKYPSVLQEHFINERGYQCCKCVAQKLLT